MRIIKVDAGSVYIIIERGGTVEIDVLHNVTNWRHPA